MSTLEIDMRPVVREEQRRPAGFAAHPRGAGFRVLSRIARIQADEADYAPRHRRDMPADLDLQTAIAI
jgi:hypothetical protein